MWRNRRACSSCSQVPEKKKKNLVAVRRSVGSVRRRLRVLDETFAIGNSDDGRMGCHPWCRCVDEWTDGCARSVHAHME